ncbi:MAG: methylmalonyl Co-A mutase-associated GTPase MeaB [Haloplanus sp.]
MSEARVDDLVAAVLDGEHHALARAITKIEDRESGYRDLVSALHAHTGDAEVIGVTGSPGAGKSTLVDKLAKQYRDRGLTVGVVAVDPSSPYSGGAVLGDRIRMASNVGDMDVFFRSMSARGQLGGLSTATADAITALDAFGKDRIVVETVGAGQNEVDVVRTADSVVVLVQPGSGDDVQMLKAGILEIGDVFVVNKADMDGAATTVSDLREMLHMRDGSPTGAAGHHGVGAMETGADERGDDDEWDPVVVETVATEGTGVEELLDVLDDHYTHLRETGELDRRERARYAEEIRQLLRADVADLLEAEIEHHGGMDALVDEVQAREADPYTVADRILDPLADCVDRRRE